MIFETNIGEEDFQDASQEAEQYWKDEDFAGYAAKFQSVTEGAGTDTLGDDLDRLNTVSHFNGIHFHSKFSDEYTECIA